MRNRALAQPLNFAAIRAASLPGLPALVRNLLPQGQQQGQEWVALNPVRSDSRLGSFKVNLRTGRWADFATGDRGGDVISLVAYLRGTTQAEAANALANELGARS